LYNPGNGLQPLFEKYVGPPINNFGVPGIRVSQINVANFGKNRAFNPPDDLFFNPYYERMLTSANETQSYIDFVTAQSANATFFTCWLGNNDVLGYAMAGAPSGGNLNIFNNMTDVATFTTNYQAMMNALLANGRKGVVVTIPYVNRAPFFTTVTLAALQAAVQQGGGPANAPIYIEAQSGIRAATSADLFLLGSQTHYQLIGQPKVGGTGAPTTHPYGLDINNPLLDAHVLDVDEVADIKARTDDFNAVIMAYASNPNVAVVNINSAVLDALASPAGFSSYGITYRSNYIQGGAFSLDGIHLTPAGYAVVANEIIKATNAKFRSTIPLVNTAQFSTIKSFTSLCQAP
jgi:lysophospholipase L1-like esterase